MVCSGSGGSRNHSEFRQLTTVTAEDERDAGESRVACILDLMESDASPLGVQSETISRGVIVKCGKDRVLEGYGVWAP